MLTPTRAARSVAAVGLAAVLAGGVAACTSSSVGGPAGPTPGSSATQQSTRPGTTTSDGSPTATRGSRHPVLHPRPTDTAHPTPTHSDGPSDYFRGGYAVVGTVVRAKGHLDGVNGVLPVLSPGTYHAQWRVTPQGTRERPPVTLVERIADAGRVTPPIQLYWDGTQYVSHATARVTCRPSGSQGTEVHMLTLVPQPVHSAHPTRWSGRDEFTSCNGSYLATLDID